MYRSKHFQTWYGGSPKDKLFQANRLVEHLRQQHIIDSDLGEEIERLRRDCENLDAQMAEMGLGRLCSRCASRAGGGCCSAYMADNTDSMQILINLLLGMEVSLREPADSECCFLGPGGCLFMAKPIFCLNYNCSHIVQGSSAKAVDLLERRAATVLSRQTSIETMLLEHLRNYSDTTP